MFYKSNKKGQAAMEFLMTYGWAILAAVIVVGVLWYMIGNPANLAGNSFQMSSPFVGNAMSISNQTIEIEIRNGGAETFTIRNVTFDSGNCSGISSQADLPAGDLQNFTISCNGLNSGERFNAEVSVDYSKSGSAITETATGSIRGIIP